MSSNSFDYHKIILKIYLIIFDWEAAVAVNRQIVEVGFYGQATQ